MRSKTGGFESVLTVGDFVEMDAVVYAGVPRGDSADVLVHVPDDGQVVELVTVLFWQDGVEARHTHVLLIPVVGA